MWLLIHTGIRTLTRFTVVSYGVLLPIYFRAISLTLGHRTIASVPIKQLWRIWVHQSLKYFGNSWFSHNETTMTSSNGNIFRVTGPLCREFTGHPHKGQWRGALVFSLICAWINGWVNNCEAGDLRRHRAHYDIIVMPCTIHPCSYFRSRLFQKQISRAWTSY